MSGIAKGGLSWIITSLVLAIVFFCMILFVQGLLMVIMAFLFFLCFVLFIMLLIFFRDPERTVGTGIVAVADGKIREITSVHDREVGECTRISTFMNIHNVHVNRMPFDGQIINLKHFPGAHIPAFQKESERNERVVLILQTSIGMMKVIQIAGTLARRIVPYVKQGDSLKKGEKIGIIRLGSRVDVLVPTNKIKQVTVTQHDKVKAGEDSIAEVND
jgi:phosphatidylserine decarboxylase